MAEAGGPGDAGGDFVEVVYATPDCQHVVRLERTSGMTAASAVQRSGLAARYPEIESNEQVLGIYGVRVAADRVLQTGDRVEICRPLRRDPRQMRRDLAARGRVMGGHANEQNES